MADHVLGDVYEDVALGNISIAYFQEDFIADLAIPTVPVKKESAKYYVFGRSHLRAEKTRRADGAESNEATYSLSKDNYTCEAEALHDLVTDRERENADEGLDLEITAVENLTQKLLITRELQASSALFTAANYGSNTSTPGTLWDVSTSDPIANIRAKVRLVKRQCGHTPNLVVVGSRVFDTLRDHPDVMATIQYGGTPEAPAIATEVALAKLLGVDRVLVGEAMQDVAAEGLAEDLESIWGDHCAILYIPTRPALKTPSAAYRFATRGGNRVVTRWREEKRKADFFEVEDIYTTKFVGSSCGYLFVQVITAE